MENQAYRQITTKGQALLEYSLILVLVTLVVIIVLALLGPSIGKTYSNVVAGLGIEDNLTSTAVAPSPVPTVAPTAVPAWTYCAEENHFCSFSGTKQVRYGENGHYFEMTLTNGTECNNEVFGDPLVGTYKHCHYR